MGIFSSRKKTYVSSVTYNLAGEVADRPDYLKSIILGNMLTQKKFNINQTIQSSYAAGTGIRLRNYHRWAKENFKQVGISRDSFIGKSDFNAEQVASIMKSDFGITAYIDWIESGQTDISMWGRQWMRENLPEKEPLDVWRTDYIDETDEAMIVFTDGTPPVVFKPIGYREAGTWLYVSYSRPLTVNRWTTPKLFLYRRGSGSTALDLLFFTSASAGEYLPHIPIRHETKFLSDTYKPEVYAEAKKAYKKAIGQKLDDLIEKIEDNPDLKEIDFAYVMFGASLNIKDMASRRYIFAYFKHLLSHQMTGAPSFNTWAGGQEGVAGAIDTWNEWLIQQNTLEPGEPVVGGAAPPHTAFTAAPSNSVIIQDNGPGKTNFKLEITWNSMTISGGLGLGKPDAKKGDVWFTFAGAQTIVPSAYTEEQIEDLEIETVEAYHQVSDTNWEKITIVGMVHINHIYNGKSVEITAAQALLDADESGFIVPIHYGVFREMSLIDSTQMATQCVNIVFNCYQIVKKKWYQRGFFKVLLVVVIVVIAVVTGGIGAGTIGLLGTAGGVGAALGFAGVAAVIAGALANMVAAMIVTQLITYASVQLLGEKIGYIVAAIATLVTLQVGSALQAGQSMTQAFSSLMNVQNVLHLTNAVGNAYTQVLHGQIRDYAVKTQDAIEDFRQESLKLQENYAENFGYGTAVFNPLALTEASESFFTETAETFLSRTLLTGSDIAQLGNDLITNFADLTLSNPFEDYY